MTAKEIEEGIAAARKSPLEGFIPKNGETIQRNQAWALWEIALQAARIAEELAKLNERES